jgi:hypothetical protein
MAGLKFDRIVSLRVSSMILAEGKESVESFIDAEIGAVSSSNFSSTLDSLRLDLRVYLRLAIFLFFLSFLMRKKMLGE